MVLTGLSLDFDVVLAYSFFTSEPLSMRKLVDMLSEYEKRIQRAVHEHPFHANLVAPPNPDLEYVEYSMAMCGGCGLFEGRE